jgi:subtilase family serine protease
MTKFPNFKATALLAAVAFLLVAPASFAQKEIVKSRVSEAVDDLQTVRLRGNVHPLAKAQFDQGALPDSQPMQRMLLLLQRGADQETSLRNLLDAQQTKGSGSYHAWLTPDSFGMQFGPSDSDLQTVTDWLTRQGFQVSKVAAGRTVIEFSGTAGQVRKSFQTEIHRFVVNSEEHFANVSDPTIPKALQPVVAGVVALHNFRKTSYMHSKGLYRRVAGTSELKPLFTYGNPANFAMSPADFNTVYSIPATATGSKQTIAVVGRSNINAQDIIDFRNLFGLPQNFTQAGNIIVNGPDPGILGPSSPGTGSDEGESDLDVEWAGAIAPNATILLVTSESTQANSGQVTDGIDLSSLYAVDNNIAPVLSDSYGSCEQGLTTAGNQFSNILWEQAAAQGITVVVASGDTGSAACDPTTTVPNAAVNGLAVTGEASTPFNVAVGGTDFDPSSLPTTPPNQYWGATNNAQQGSALKYIPEVAWDDSPCAFNFPAACTGVDSSGSDIAAAGGGLSTCTITDSNGNCTTSGYAKPSWQTNFSSATTRAVPDISLFAANGGNGIAYIVCQADNLASGASCSLNSPFTDFGLAGGTSFSTPAFAAIMALVNEKTGERQGNANYVLYALAANDLNYASGACGSSVGATPAATCVYNDVTKGNISVACVAGTANCSNKGTSGFGILITAQNSPAYTAGKGFEPATGLGSINVTNLLNKWASVTRTVTTTTLTNASGGTPSGTAFSGTATVGPPGATGDVSLIAYDGSVPPVAVGSFGPFTLSAGTAAIATAFLPANSVSLVASYGGDATHARSTSAPVALTVAGANQVSKVTLNFVSMDNNGNITGINTGAQKLAYGSEFYILNIVVTGTLASGQPCGFGHPITKPAIPCPTGKISLTDNGAALNDFPSGPLPNATNMAKLNNLGLAEDQPINLGVGTHSVVAAYAGDPNYQAGTSNALSITFTQAATSTAVQSSPATVPSGGTVTITATVNTNSNGVGPTGTVQFANGTSNIGTAVACAPTSASASSSGTAFCTATVKTMLSALPPVAPVNRRAPRMPILPTTLLALVMIVYLVYVQRIQKGRRRNFAYAGLLAFALLVAGVSGCGGGGSSSGGGHTVTLNASYVGDANYTASSGSTTVVVK